MKIRLKDIIDLEYLIRRDDALESKSDIESLAARDREIFDQCKGTVSGKKELLLAWLSIRKEQFVKEQENRSTLPGSTFAVMYHRALYLLLMMGFGLGMMTIYSFLAYHGSHPINVMTFTGLFVVLPVLFMLVNILIWLKNGFNPLFFPHMASVFFLNAMAAILRKFKASDTFLHSLEFIQDLIKTQSSEFKPLFFWPFFILTSVFAFGFSVGTLLGTFVKVLVSDMAFGWQSTVVEGAQTVYQAVRGFAFPWAWMLPEGIGYPAFDQIEGSRIVLKDGIMALATQDLVSWWPFLCLGILFYALVPRAGLIVLGTVAQGRLSSAFDFEKSRFSQLILRMKSQVLEIDTLSQKGQPLPQKEKPTSKSPAGRVTQKNKSENRAFVLLSETAFDADATKIVSQYIKEQMFLSIDTIIPVCFDFEKDSALLTHLHASKPDQIVLVYEVWQPPIRGVLFYMKQLLDFLPQKTSLCLLLTQDAGQTDLSVDKNDMNLAIWETAIAKMADFDIGLKRFL